jgi:hypothetical protein
MKIEHQKIAAQYWAGFPARGLVLLAWPSGPCQPVRRTHAWRDHRGVDAVAARSTGVAGGLRVARPAETPRGSDGGSSGKVGWLGSH